MIWPYIVLSYISLFALGLSDNIRGPLYPEILRTFQLNDSQGALLFAMSSISSFFGSISGSHLLQRYNKIRVLDLGLGLCSLGLMGLALAPTFYWMLGSSVFFGISMGIMGVSQNTLAALGSTPEKRNRILAGLHSMYGLASLLAPLFVSLVWTQLGSWRWVFGLAAIVPIGIVLYSFFSNSQVEPMAAKNPNASVSKESMGLRLWVALMLGSYVITEIMVSSRLALYMTRVKSQSLEAASFYVSGFFVFLLLGRLACTFFHPKAVSLRNQLLIYFGATVGLLFAGLYIHPLGFVLSGFSMAPIYPLSISYMAEKFPQSLEKTISTAMATQSFLIVLMHLGVGRLTDMFGIHAALFLGPAAVLVAVVLLLSFDSYYAKIHS